MAIDAGAGAPRNAPKNTSPFLRLMIFGAAVLVIIYATFAFLRIEQLLDDPAGALDNKSRADVLAARIEGDVRSLRAALTAAGALAQRLPQSPVDAAEAAMSASGGGAKAVAILGPEGLRAQTAPDAGWLAAAQAAKASGLDLWIGTAAGRRAAHYAVYTTDTVAVAALIDLDATLPVGGSDEISAISTRDGVILAIKGRTGLPPTLSQALGVSPVVGAKPAGMESTGRLPDGAAFDVAQKPVPNTDLVVAVASPQMAGAVARRAIERDTVFSLLAPLIIAIGLALLLTIQSRRANEARRAQIELEQRFRLAVEAARCGIW